MMNKFGSLKCLALLLVFVSCCANAQVKKPKGGQKQPQGMVFRDTLYNIAFDSLSNDLYGLDQNSRRLVKHFKYLGKPKEPLVLKAWTQDPHFICDYPREPLVLGRIYAFTVCFTEGLFKGNTRNSMGFELSDGHMVTFEFYRYSGPQRTISGKVTDASGKPISGADVFLRLNGKRHAKTDRNGHYQIRAKPGEDLAFSFKGMHTAITSIGQDEVNATLIKK